MSQGATTIYKTDDDNIPMPSHGFPPRTAKYDCIKRDDDWVNIYQFFAPPQAPNIWPRGYPLDLILRKENLKTVNKTINISIWQGLADHEPDVDAIYRLTCNAPYNFAQREPVVLEKGAWCPFNTQNTLFYPDVFPLLYVPSTVSFRFADILRSIVCQAIMHKFDHYLGFTNASVKQIRNAHHYMDDFESEVPMFLQIKTAKNAAIAGAGYSTLEDCLGGVYKELYKNGIVQELELELVDAWLTDCQKYS